MELKRKGSVGRCGGGGQGSRKCSREVDRMSATRRKALSFVATFSCLRTCGRSLLVDI